MTTSTAPARSLNEQPQREGVRVVLRDDWGFFDKGDAGTILEHEPETGLCRVWLDGGAEQDFPSVMLEREVGDFRLMHPGERLSAISYPTEAEAASAAERYGYATFRVMRVREVARYSPA